MRELYGTVLNEGANRGILVTTSHFGRDAHEWASNKPLTLIDGPNLLALLSKHGYNFRKAKAETMRLTLPRAQPTLAPTGGIGARMSDLTDVPWRLVSVLEGPPRRN